MLERDIQEKQLDKTRLYLTKYYSVLLINRSVGLKKYMLDCVTPRHLILGPYMRPLTFSPSPIYINLVTVQLRAFSPNSILTLKCSVSERKSTPQRDMFGPPRVTMGWFWPSLGSAGRVSPRVTGRFVLVKCHRVIL
jgi:hypothetical protein